ncbi:hypothetical protein MSAN_01967900 [Mycena sanguinolenta]|uniref:Uncharacterized protein n=1 Tax=Mycena sanguinolenta TaxID=230812 RepID=A0A8H6XP15_9AGAR|nr:hypothetical protein MSAN_01967900 [Mycena sanguinolenta]
MMNKFTLLAISPFVVASLLGTAAAAPVGADLSIMARKGHHTAAVPAAGSQVAAASSGTPTPCTNTDQSAAAFGGGDDPDENLPLCSTVANPFSCTNIQAVATDFNLPLCSQAGEASSTAIAASAPAPAAPPAAANGSPIPCTNTDQSAAAFGGGEDPDENLPLCSTVANPFSCTNIQAVATDFNLPLCSEAGTGVA